MLTVKAFSFNPVEENTYVLYNEKGGAALLTPVFIFPKKEKNLKDLLKKITFNPFYC
jgi:hypothetical protein